MINESTQYIAKKNENATPKYSYIAASVEATFKGPTNSRGSRVIIHSAHLKKSKIISWDYTLNGTAVQAINAIIPGLENPEFAAPRVTYSETKTGYLVQFHGENDWDLVKKFFKVEG